MRANAPGPDSVCTSHAAAATIAAAASVRAPNLTARNARRVRPFMIRVMVLPLETFVKRRRRNECSLNRRNLQCVPTAHARRTRRQDLISGSPRSAWPVVVGGGSADTVHEALVDHRWRADPADSHRAEIVRHRSVRYRAHVMCTGKTSWMAARRLSHEWVTARSGTTRRARVTLAVA